MFYFFIFSENKHKVFEILSMMSAWKFQFLKKNQIVLFLLLWVVFPPSCCSSENKCSHFCQSQVLSVLITIWNEGAFIRAQVHCPHTYVRHSLPPESRLCVVLGLMADDLPNRILREGMWLTWLHAGFVPWRLGVIGIVVRNSG